MATCTGVAAFSTCHAYGCEAASTGWRPMRRQATRATVACSISWAVGVPDRRRARTHIRTTTASCWPRRRSPCVVRGAWARSRAQRASRRRRRNFSHGFRQHSAMPSLRTSELSPRTTWAPTTQCAVGIGDSDGALSRDLQGAGDRTRTGDVQLGKLTGLRERKRLQHGTSSGYVQHTLPAERSHRSEKRTWWTLRGPCVALTCNGSVSAVSSTR